MAKKYFILSLKRAFSYFFFLFFSMIITLGILGFIFGRQAKNQINRVEKNKISIGLVGDKEDAYIQRGLAMLQAFDSSRHTVEFLLLKEKEAEKKVLDGKLVGYIKIPKDFGNDLYYGQVKELDYVSLNDRTGIRSFITKHILWNVETILGETQKGIYAFQNLAMKKYLKKTAEAKGDAMALYYLERLLDRNSLYRVKEVGIEKNITWTNYYFVSMLVIFFWLLAFISGGYFNGNTVGIKKALMQKGLVYWKQIFLECFAYLLMIFVNVFLLFSVLFIFFLFVNPPILFIDFNWRVLLMAFPLPIALILFHFCIYEWLQKNREAMLMEFLLGGLLLFLNGIIYPLHYMPEILEKWGRFLPMGGLHTYLCQVIKGESVVISGGITFFWCLCFFFLILIFRKRRIGRS